MGKNKIEVASGNKKAKSMGKGPMNLCLIQKLDKIVQHGKKGGKLRQTSMNDACDKEARVRIIQYIARFFYQAGIPFNAAHLDSFKWMIKAIGRYGPNLKPPSYNELRVPLLKKELAYIEDLLKGHKDEWAKHGCSIMSDGWKDKRERTLINFFVNCPLETKFVESIDASSFVKTGKKTFELLDSFVEWIGEANVVQVINGNGSNYKLARHLKLGK
ncbi:uncharacterized protein LOC131178620 [Hevea brasiliensis]|uniref:uncharacterized protein LOC131178620 n=1 Tax=Hevea brasiliensis TaxID=3981 RepID=UPI0025CE7D3F|nr:uncharacterized protein LOC131178620 [Hevea brasiliensis]